MVAKRLDRCDRARLLGGIAELAEYGRQLMAGAAALQLDLVAALRDDRQLFASSGPG